MVTTRCVTLLFLVTLTHAALPLPSYMKPCARNDPNFHACVLEHGKAAIPQLVKGDRKYGIPNLDPVEIAEITIPSSSFTLHCKNLKVKGMKDVDLKRVEFNLTNGEVIYEMVFPVLEMIGEYEIDGRIILLPITGKGNMNCSLENAKTKSHFNFKFVEIEGIKHLEFYNPKTEVDPQQVHFDFTNLFNGNKLLGDEMNQLLNREWKDAWRDFGPAIIQAANTIVQTISDNFAKRVSLDSWFPENL